MGRYDRGDYLRAFGGGNGPGRQRPGYRGGEGWGGYGRPYDGWWRERGWGGYPPPRYDGGSGRPVRRGYHEGFQADAPRDAYGSYPRGAAWGGDRTWQGESDVDRIRAADIMTPNPEAVTPDTSLMDIALRMRELDVGVMPVVDDEDSLRLQGVVTDRDIAVRAAAEGKDMRKTTAREIMTTALETVGENDHVRDVFAVMKRARVRRVPITDAGGRLVGIIAQADLAVNYAGLDLQRETEVEEVIERISEPARPRWGRGQGEGESRSRAARVAEVDLPDRLRAGWSTLRREARHLMRRGYDRGWR